MGLMTSQLQKPGQICKDVHFQPKLILKFTAAGLIAKPSSIYFGAKSETLSHRNHERQAK